MAGRIVKWLPAVIAPALVAGVAIAVPLSASASPDLAPKSAAQILALVARSESISGFTGTVSETADLGLPELTLPSAGGGSSATGGLDLLTGTHTAKVYAAGNAKSRVQLLDSRGERDVYRNGSTVWVWDSSDTTAEKLAARQPTTTQQVADPTALAREALAKIDGSTAVTTDANITVAGRDAYGLVLTPKTDATLVGHIDIAVDAVTGLPLKVAVFARGASGPALDVEFTDLTLGAPSSSVFEFTPPAGATVSTPKAPARQPAVGTHAKPTVTGSGWATIVSTTTDATTAKALEGNSLFSQVAKPVDGGHLISLSLLSVLVTADGHVFAGAVPGSALVAAAG